MYLSRIHETRLSRAWISFFLGNGHRKSFLKDSMLLEKQFDTDGNQTLIKTDTGIWSTVYNAENRPISFLNEATGTMVECAYDRQGRRTYKKVSINGNITLHQRFIYRGYLQIACVDLTRSHYPALWLITWDPTQQTATRPLALQKDGTWYTYGWDLTKNICEVYRNNGYIGTIYTYAPYGEVCSSGDIEQPVQWSSEIHDSTTCLTYYNFRNYSANHGTWTTRDFLETRKISMYSYCQNRTMFDNDSLGLQCVLPHHSSTGVPGGWESDNYRAIVETNRSWSLAIHNLHNWRHGKILENI